MVSTTNEPVRMNDRHTPPHPAAISDDPDVIRAQIERTRAQMGRTLDEIQVRLSPDYIKKQTQDSIREATIEKVEQMAYTAERKVNNWRSNAMQTIKENPVPAAMIGIGLGWLLLSDNNGRHDDYEYSERYYNDFSERPAGGYYNYGYGRTDYGRTGREPGAMAQVQSRAAETAENAQEWVGEKGDQVRKTAKNVADTVQDQATATSEAVRENVNEATTRAQDYVAETTAEARERVEETRRQAEQTAMQMQQQAREQARRAKQTFWHTMETNPLAVGIAAAAAGAVIGLALPSTQKEKELMGETRDRLVEEVSTTAAKTMSKAQTVAEQAAQTAVEEAKREAEKQNLTPPPTARETTRKTSGQSTPSV